MGCRLQRLGWAKGKLWWYGTFLQSEADPRPRKLAQILDKLPLMTNLYTLLLYNNSPSLVIPADQIVVLPSSLRELRCGPSFNQPIRLPDNLLVLKLGRYFNQRLEIPDCLTDLKVVILQLGCLFDQNLEDKLPTNLKSLRLSNKYNKRLGDLPSGLTVIKSN